MTHVSYSSRSLVRRGGHGALGLALVFVGALLFGAGSAHAQFRNNGMKLPSVGYFALGNTMDGLNEAASPDQPSKNRWGATDQGTIGVGYFRAVGYNLWFDSDTNIGLGGQLGSDKTLVSLLVSLGLRYNFLDEKHRPFVAGYFQYLQFFNFGPGIATNELTGFPLWVGARPTVGYEWFFAEEMSLTGELAPVVLVGLDLPAPKFAGVARLSYSVYF
ncbi:MAG: hypothetical protein ACO3JL_01040 [Myxococcota bacterium]